jgi:hypothetical protein
VLTETRIRRVLKRLLFFSWADSGSIILYAFNEEIALIETIVQPKTASISSSQTPSFMLSHRLDSLLLRKSCSLCNLGRSAHNNGKSVKFQLNRPIDALIRHAPSPAKRLRNSVLDPTHRTQKYNVGANLASYPVLLTNKTPPFVCLC